VDTDVGLATDWEAEITGWIDAAIDRGFFLVLLSREALRSVSMQRELEHAVARQAEQSHERTGRPLGFAEGLPTAEGADQ